MRRFGYMIMTLMMVVLVLGACQRRPFAENRSKLTIALNIDTDIVNHTMDELPENVRVDLYDPQTRALVYTDYIGPTGGVVHPAPGKYDMLIYSIGTESTQIHNEHDYNAIEAYTNEVPAHIKSQLSQFMAMRAKAARERFAGLTVKGDATDEQTKDPVQYTDEPVVNQPDHIFVGRHDQLHIPVSYEGEPIDEVYVEVDAHTLVETWQVEIRNVDGAEWISRTVALASSQSGSVHIGPNMASDKVVSVLFDMKVEDREDGGKCLKGKFNTFGLHPDRENEVNMDISVMNMSGGEQTFHFDITDQFENNPQRYILIQEPIEVEKSKVGGGFQPEVDDWDDIHTDIIL